MVGIALHDLAQPVGLQILLIALAQIERDEGAAPGLLALLDGEVAAPVRNPQPGGFLAGLAGQHLDLLGHHEGGIEADAELADQVRVLLGIAAQLAQEGRCAGARDGPQIGDQLVAVHADAIVGNGQRARLRVGGERDRERAILAQHPGIGKCEIAQLVTGVRRVGDQLAQEDFLLAVERVHDDIEEAADFRLEGELFCRHEFFLFLLLGGKGCGRYVNFPSAYKPLQAMGSYAHETGTNEKGAPKDALLQIAYAESLRRRPPRPRPRPSPGRCPGPWLPGRDPPAR